MSNNKQSSSVEWLFEELFNSFEKFNNGEFSFAEYMAHNLKLRKQAKKKHKDEIKNAFTNGFISYRGSNRIADENFYNETFGDNND